MNFVRHFCYLLLQTVEEIYKVASISLSPNVPAQIFVSQIVFVHGKLGATLYFTDVLFVYIVWWCLN